MGKLDELRILRRQRSTDAPINIHGRTGESSDVGSMLDLYTHSESPEEIILARDDVKARERFQSGFDVYLNRIFDEREREFLRELLHGERTAAKVGAAFGVNYFEFLQSIQQKAYKNAKPLIKLARLSGWKGAVEFISDILQRLQQLQNGAQLNEIIPQNKRELEKRAIKRELGARFYARHRERTCARVRLYKKTHKKEILEYKRQYRALHREKDIEYRRKYYITHREKENEYKRKYCKTHPEKEKERKKRYYAKQRREKLVLAFEALSEALTLWIEAGKPKNGEFYAALEKANKNATRKFLNWYEKLETQ